MVLFTQEYFPISRLCFLSIITLSCQRCDNNTW
jgi:hypothetical protein